jgi:hypothetical protein
MDDAETIEQGEEQCSRCSALAIAWGGDPEEGRCESHWFFPQREPGDLVYFEYHCHQDHDSGDALAWYHSRQPATIVKRDLTEVESVAWMYTVRFADGLTWDVFEDELHDSPGEFGTQASVGGGFQPPDLDSIARAVESGVLGEHADSARRYLTWAAQNGHADLVSPPTAADQEA